MPEINLMLYAVVITALLFDFINGFHDTANAIATSVSTRVLPLRPAIMMAAVLNFVGAFTNTAVATTIGKGIVHPGIVTQKIVLSALLAAIAWNLVTWYYALPSSSSHALIGGIIGSVVAARGFGALNLGGLGKILLSLIISPVFGFVVGFLFMVGLMRILAHTSPARVNRYFSKLQILSAAFMAFSHGSNDAQKSMGIITMALFSAGAIPTFHVPVWVIMAAALSMALGTSIGGWRIIKTMGVNIIKLLPVHGFAAETSSTLVILGATALGLPVSTTHVISSAIMGVGASKRLSAVRWGIARNIVWAWVFTIPVTAVVAALIHYIAG
ncbi:MAG: inorganic phosphate transporter [Firmicutes bacterium]|nr:inorganic phosphate transporter [Bacillota bacterium]